MILGKLIGIMGQPGSELATWNWLQQHSALGELMDVDFLSMSHSCLYRASDVLMKHREVIETRLFSTAWFGWHPIQVSVAAAKTCMQLSFPTTRIPVSSPRATGALRPQGRVAFSLQRQGQACGLARLLKRSYPRKVLLPR